jgi:hypothetical protein
VSHNLIFLRVHLKELRLWVEIGQLRVSNNWL